jgi:hypothetical protein
MTLRATDDGSPVLSSDFTYTIHVYPAGQTVVVVHAQLLLDSLQLTWTATPGKTYQIQSTENLSPAAWAPLGPNLVADGPNMIALFPLSVVSQVSLRVVQLD